MYCNVLYHVYFEGYDNQGYDNLSFSVHHEFPVPAVLTLKYFLIIQRTKGNRQIIV